MSAVTGPKLAPKTQAPQGKSDSKNGNAPQQPKVVLKTSRNLPETFYNRPNPLPKNGPKSEPKTPDAPKAGDAPKTPIGEPVKDAGGQPVQSKDGNPVVKDSNGVNVASDVTTGKPVTDPKTGNPVILDDQGNPADAPKSIKPDPTVKSTDAASTDYPKYHADDKTGKTTFYDKDSKAIPPNGEGAPVAVYTDKAGQDHYYDRQTGEKIEDQNDPRLPGNLPKDGPNALPQPPELPAAVPAPG